MIRFADPPVADNVSSTAAHSGAPGYAAYAASKAVVSAMTRVAALEYATAGVRVNAIVPGPIPMNDDEPSTGMGPGTAMERRARPKEISPLVAYLLCGDAGFVTGTEFAIDGGYLAQRTVSSRPPSRTRRGPG